MRLSLRLSVDDFQASPSHFGTMKGGSGSWFGSGCGNYNDPGYGYGGSYNDGYGGGYDGYGAGYGDGYGSYGDSYGGSYNDAYGGYNEGYGGNSWGRGKGAGKDSGKGDGKKGDFRKGGWGGGKGDFKGGKPGSSGNFPRKDLDEDDEEKMKEEMAAEMEKMERQDDNESDGSDELPPPASKEEIAEAQDIVKKAQDDLVERNKMKAKVKDASKSDLQAMINARLAKRWTHKTHAGVWYTRPVGPGQMGLAVLWPAECSWWPCEAFCFRHPNSEKNLFSELLLVVWKKAADLLPTEVQRTYK